MNFFNQLTSVFNPDLTTILGSPSAAHMQASVGGLLPHCWHLLWSGVRLLSFTCLIQMNVFPKSLCFMAQCLYWSLQSIVNPSMSERFAVVIYRLRVIVMTLPPIRPSRPRWKMPLFLRMCQAYRNLVSIFNNCCFISHGQSNLLSGGAISSATLSLYPAYWSISWD